MRQNSPLAALLGRNSMPLAQKERVARIAGHLLGPVEVAASATDQIANFKEEAKVFVGEQKSVDEGPKTEAQVRVELAAAYRIAAMLGWDDSIANHFTVRVPGKEDQFLVNSFGMGFDEVTASSLVKIDHAGNILDPGSVRGAVNTAGFGIHGAIHKARPDAVCVMHTHEANVTAVASMKCGLLPMSQTALFNAGVTYHPFGFPLAPGECEAMCKSIGPRSKTLLMQNHGVVCVGKSVPEAFFRAYYIHKAAEIQVKALGQNPTQSGVEALTTVAPEVIRDFNEDFVDKFCAQVGPDIFAHHMRKLDKVNPGYEN